MSGVTTAAAPANAEATAKMMATRAKRASVATGVGAAAFSRGKTRLLPRGSHPPGRDPRRACAAWRGGGVDGARAGLGPRVLFHIPAGAISWATYEAGRGSWASEANRWGGDHH